MLLIMPSCKPCLALNAEALADSIYLAEGGTGASKPYGIMKDYCFKGNEKQCRKGCIQTVEKWRKRWSGLNHRDFINKFGDIYAPTRGASNDPSNLNRNWKRNVLYFYEHP